MSQPDNPDKLFVVRGHVSHESHDKVSREQFERGFKLHEDLLISFPLILEADALIKRGEGKFPWILGVRPISYMSWLEAALNQAWGSFEKHDDIDTVVGDVDGININRPVRLYRRVETLGSDR